MEVLGGECNYLVPGVTSIITVHSGFRKFQSTTENSDGRLTNTSTKSFMVILGLLM